MYCPKCGNQNPDDAQLCSSCSTTLTAAAPAGPAPDAKTSGLAITSLVLGILSVLCGIFTAIPAIILGIVALTQINKSPDRLKGKGLAIAGIIVPAVMVLISTLFMLLAIFMPALTNARGLALRMVCTANLNGLGKAMQVYAYDYDDKYPTSSKWCDLLIEHTRVTEKQFRCQDAPEGPCNYAMNSNIAELTASTAPPDMVLLFETEPGWNQIGGPEILTTDHRGKGCNILFADGRVEFVQKNDIGNLQWEVQKER